MAKAIDPLARVLLMLLRDGSAPRSAAGARALASMQTLIDSGAIKIVRRGAGDALQIASRSALDRFIVAHYPAGLHWAMENPTRADAAIYARDSKRGRVPFSLVTFHGRAGTFTQNGQELLLQYGTPSSIFLDDPDKDRPVFSGITSLALIENLEVFRDYLAAGIEADMAFWTSGKMSDRFLTWLGSPAWTAVPRVIHCGDYDVVGLREFDRVFRLLGARATLFVPPNIEVLFEHGTGDLLDKQRDGQFQAFLTHPDPGCRQIADLIIQFGRGLEQETLLGATVPASPG